MYLRFLAVLSLCLTAACASSPYEAGKSAADVPSKIDVIKLDKVASFNGGFDSDVDKSIDPNPSQNDSEVMSAVKAAVISQFENYGMHIVEDGTRPPDVRVRLYVSYQPELGLLVHRSVIVGIRVLDTDGTPLLRMGAAQAMSLGLIGSLIVSRDDFVTAVARDAVIGTVGELQKGTKEPAGKPADPAVAVQPSPGTNPPGAPVS
ncbi:hypothetical protein GCM10011611_34850 [Aliidongia dinghuensis]|uniref:DUF4410 domain-containing protein n=1 Tax=Aliidongia dinghuensis TaxID=1867774 RepID=A0A8J2YVJ4_9PROT|nr:hypothetical protein [Aliidongia dinghuensis]GGF25818.1 hypothetical protein GCM10011611_34850 [Aliidongia dinghuensis]